MLVHEFDHLAFVLSAVHRGSENYGGVIVMIYLTPMPRCLSRKNCLKWPATLRRALDTIEDILCQGVPHERFEAAVSGPASNHSRKLRVAIGQQFAEQGPPIAAYLLLAVCKLMILSSGGEGGIRTPGRAL